MKLVHWLWLLMGGLLHLVQRGGDWAGPQPNHRIAKKWSVLYAFNAPTQGLTNYTILNMSVNTPVPKEPCNMKKKRNLMQQTELYQSIVASERNLSAYP